MIATLRGKVVAKFKDGVALRVPSGMGYRVQMPTPFLASAQVGEELFCYTHLVVRKQQWKFFGFKTEPEMEFFGLLLTVQKVGPRVALAALSTATPQALATAITNEQPEFLTHIPGVGKKTAKRIIIDLKGNVGKYTNDLTGTVSADDGLAISALMALAYTKAEARAAIKGLGSNLKLDEKIWLALQRLNKERDQ